MELDVERACRADVSSRLRPYLKHPLSTSTLAEHLFKKGRHQGWAAYLQFRILQYQFSSGNVLFLPTAVRVARAFVQRWVARRSRPRVSS